jgi:hypothetical protein
MLPHIPLNVTFVIRSLAPRVSFSSLRDDLAAVDPVKLTDNASRIADRQTTGRDIAGYDATRTDSGVAFGAAGHDANLIGHPA